MEINTSAMDRIGDFLPSVDFLRRFKELGGQIITVGSDAHTTQKVGAYMNDAISLAKEIKKRVMTRFGISLEPEVDIVGTEKI